MSTEPSSARIVTSDDNTSKVRAAITGVHRYAATLASLTQNTVVISDLTPMAPLILEQISNLSDLSLDIINATSSAPKALCHFHQCLGDVALIFTSSVQRGLLGGLSCVDCVCSCACHDSSSTNSDQVLDTPDIEPSMEDATDIEPSSSTEADVGEEVPQAVTPGEPTLFAEADGTFSTHPFMGVSEALTYALTVLNTPYRISEAHQERARSSALQILMGAITELQKDVSNSNSPRKRPSAKVL